MELISGTLLEGGKYRIISTLGRGGYGITYLAEHVFACHNVCIKEFFPNGYYKRDEGANTISILSQSHVEIMSRFKVKFINEAKTILKLRHPNIIQILDVFEANNTAYYVMEYVDGSSLNDMVKQRGALAEADAVRYIRMIASALDYIHEQKINHLDIKPSNIMVSAKDDKAVLIDFGLSKHYDEVGDQTSSTPVGISHGYAPMEQYDVGGVNSFSPATDIYSLGATLYALVTGKQPPVASVVGEDGIGNLPAHLRGGVVQTIEKSMSYWRKSRPQSISEFMLLLDSSDNTEQKPVEEVEGKSDKSQKSDNKSVVEKFEESDKTIIEHTITPEKSLDNKPKSKSGRWWLWSLLMLVVIGIVCAVVMNVGDDVTNCTTYKVGDYYNENGKKGIVFEVWDGGRHGKIVSLDETKVAWDSRVKIKDGKWINGTKTYADRDSDGKDNTDKLMSRNDSQYFLAAKWCRDKGASWYLPANNELKAIYKNKDKINNSLTKVGATTLSSWHWSSTEDDEFSAWLVYMYDGYTYNYRKNYFNCVRAVSAF